MRAGWTAQLRPGEFITLYGYLGREVLNCTGLSRQSSPQQLPVMPHRREVVGPQDSDPTIFCSSDEAGLELESTVAPVEALRNNALQ